MSGILNKKNRIIDYKLTENGRKQIQNGDIKFKYYTLSDSSLVYYQDSDSVDNLISSSEYFYMPFEVSTDPYQYINPEFNLTEQVDFTNNLEVLSTEYTRFIDLNALNSAADQIISKNYLNHKDVIDDQSNFSFYYKKTKEEFNFNANEFDNIPILSYPTIKQAITNLSELSNISNDQRFSNKLNFMNLVPINKDGTEILEIEKKEPNPVKHIYNTLSIDAKLKTSDSREEAIEKIVNLLKEKSFESIHKNVYKIDNKSVEKKYFYEMHEVSYEYSDEIDVSLANLVENQIYKIVEIDEVTTVEDWLSLGVLEESSIALDSEFIAKGTSFNGITGNSKVSLKNKKLSKLAFLDLGDFYNSILKKSFKVFLIGKVLHNEKSYTRENLSLDYNSNVLTRNILTDYTFVNLFTLILE